MPTSPLIFLPAPQNSIRVFKEDNALPSIYNIYPFDVASYDQHTLPSQMHYPYQQKARFNDQITLMFHTQYEEGAGSFKPYLEILDYNDNVVLNITSDPMYYKGQVINPYMTYQPPASTTSYPLKSDLFSFKFGQFLDVTNANTGIYRVKVVNTHSSLPYETWMSEPILLFDNVQRTILVEANNNSNKDLWIIDGWDGGYIPTASIRLEGDYRSLQNQAYVKSYRKQNFLLNQTVAYTWRQFELHLGDMSEGLPEYMLETVSNLLLMDNMRIENKYFMLKKEGDEGNILNVKDPKTVPLLTATAIIEEKYAYQNAISGNTLTLFTLDEGFDARAIAPFKMSDGIDVISFAEDVFYSLSDLDDYVTYINETVIPAEGITGYAYRDGYSIIYKLGAGEMFNSVYSLYYDNFIYDKYLKIPCYVPDTTAPAAQRRLFFDATTSHIGTPYLISDNGSGQIQFYSAASRAYVQLDHDSEPIVYVFFKNDLKQIGLNSDVSTSASRIRTFGGDAIEGNWPNTLEVLSIRNQTMNYFEIPTLPQSLISITITNCSINTISRIFNGVNLLNLKTIDISNSPLYSTYKNELSSSAVDELFNDFYTNTPVRPSGFGKTIRIRNYYTPLAPPTSASSTARAALTTDLYFITTD